MGNMFDGSKIGGSSPKA